jgi:ParB family chromosome partitioning protein
MARKNMFEGITPDRPDPGAPPALQPETPRMPEVFQHTGPVAAIRNDLRSLGSRSVQEIDPGLIEDTGLKDRLAVDDDELAALRDSIARHGQQVPILLRPHPRLSGRYQVVYGRRRLAAIRGLGTPVKALIRTLSDEEAVLAQGQENNLRKDPSFIEKALFAGDLEDAGYDAKVVQDALNVNRSHTSHMRKVREAFPRDVIERIGAAPSVGWKRWYDLAGRVLDQQIDPRAVHPAPFPADYTSDQRFEAWAKALQTPTAPRAPAGAVPVLAPDGSQIGSVKLAKGAVTFQAAAPRGAFAAWLARNPAEAMQMLHQGFLARSGDDTSPQPTRSSTGKG